MPNAACGLWSRSLSPRSFHFVLNIGSPPRFYSLISILFGLLLLLTGCKGENNPSRPELPAGIINISKSNSLSIAPDTAASGSNVYVVWQELAGGQNMEIFLSRSADSGATFGDPINISQSTASSTNPRIAVSGNFVYVVWEEAVPTDVEAQDIDIFYRRGQDENGTFTWYPPLNESGLRLSSTVQNCRDLTQTPGDDPCVSFSPAVVASGSNLFVAWSESTIYQFKVDNTLNPPSKTFQNLNSEILVVRSTDGGQQFDQPLTVSGPKTDATPSPSSGPTLAAAAGRIYIAWEDKPLPQPTQNPQAKVLFRILADPLNSTFSPPLSQPPTLLSGFIRESSRPNLAAEGDRVYLAWEGFLPSNGTCPAVQQDNTPVTSERSEIFFIHSEDDGSHFSDPNNCAQSNFSNTVGNSNGPRLVASGPFVYLTWMDSTPGLAGILFRKSADNGNTFTAPALLVPGGGSTANPSIAASGGTLFTSWEDATLGNLEVVFTIHQE